MVNKSKRAKTQAPAKAERPPLWNHRLFPPVFFLVLSLLYFYEFPLSDKIVFGMDVGTDYHKGADLSFWDKVQTVDQPMWDPKMGGFPQSEGHSPAVLPGIRPLFFYDLSAVYWLALHPDDVCRWFGDVRVLAANPRGGSRGAVGRGGVHVCADFLGVSVGWSLRQDGGSSPCSRGSSGRWNELWRRGG